MNPFLGVFFHWLGGLASGSFYVPYKGVRKWAWEVYWLVGGFFSWIICPSVLASLLTHNLPGVLGEQSASTLWWTYFFGAMWGFGGLTFGLTMRYLGMSLGMGVALGYCAAFGTLLPPIFKTFMPSIPVSETISQIIATHSGRITLAGVVVCLLGIGVAALAGLTKEREMPEEQKKKAIKEFNFAKGILVATFSGIMSACFAFGLTAGKPIEDSNYCSEIILAAAGEGKTLPKGAVVNAGEADAIVKELGDGGFFKDAEKNVKEHPGFASVVEALEAPVTLDAKLADLGLHVKDAKPEHEADLENEVAKLKENLESVNRSFPAQIAVLKQSKSAIAQRLLKYQAAIESLRGKTKELNIIGGMKDLIRKEVAVSSVQSGASFVAHHEKHKLWTGLPVLIVVLLGGFTTNFIWCVLLAVKNKTGYQFFSSTLRQTPPARENETIIETAVDAPSEEVVEHSPGRGQNGGNSVPYLSNFLFSALAGTTWYFQFFFYTMGATQMGKYDFASWTLHMASIIIFSTMWGWIFHEWKGSSKKAHSLIASGILALILSTIVIGYGTYKKGQTAEAAPAAEAPAQTK